MACACVYMHARSCRCVYVRERTGVCAFGCCFVGANGLLVDVCQCCCLLMFCMLTAFETLSLLQNLVNKESESKFCWSPGDLSEVWIR